MMTHLPFFLVGCPAFAVGAFVLWMEVRNKWLRWEEIGLAAVWIPLGLTMVVFGLTKTEGKMMASFILVIACLLIWATLAWIVRKRVGRKI